jgi:ABC-type antimicrobial peptide transport system permease subunit
MASLSDESLGQARLQAYTTAAFAGIALMLALAGIYGVVAYAMSRRVCELGLRSALGARQRDILTLVLRQGIVPIAVGTLVGVAGALSLARFLSTILFDITPHHAGVILAVVLVVAVSGVVACLSPGVRALRADPMVALRME